MSLLLDALRRAEQDSKKRKLAEGVPPSLSPATELSDPALAADQEGSAPELTLEPQSSGQSLEFAPTSTPTLELLPADVPDQAGAELTTAAPEIEPKASFLDFVLPADDEPLQEAVIPASLAPRATTASYGRYERPAGENAFVNSNWDALTSNAAPLAPLEPPQADTSYPAPIKPMALRMAELPAKRAVDAPLSEATPFKPAPKNMDAPPSVTTSTPRQALAAAGVMAGKKPVKTVQPPQRRRQWLLLALVLLLALPLSAFLVFGDRLFGSSSSLVAVNPPLSAPAVVNPASVTQPESAVPAADAGTPVVPATEAVAAAAPAPAARPPATFNTQRSVRAPSMGTARNDPSRSRSGATAGRSPALAASGVSTTQAVNAARPASLMDSAYAAYQAGNSAEASRLYREVLKADDTQRDAWLGLAVIAHAANQLESAMDAYRRVLRLEPQNATALAGVSSISRAAGEPLQESRLRELLVRSPQEADLNHALALVLSGEQRWSEAQPLFFKAHALAPKEPQFAYNLAVTLDHMRKTTLAAQYYETALTLAQGRAAGFDELNARTRLGALRAAK